MKLGLIADIHCDLMGLARALDLFREKHVDRVLCAGDLVEKGLATDGDAVVEWLRRAKIPCVRGNHDFDALANQQWLRENGDPANPNLAARLLCDETLAILEALPLTLVFEWEGRRVLLAHGTPWSDAIYLYESSRAEVYRRIHSESGAEVVILGHTHRPMHVRYGELCIVNPGSVCGAAGLGSGSRTCATLSLPDGRFDTWSLTTGQRVEVPLTVIEPI